MPAETGTTPCIPPRHRVENFFQRSKRFRSVTPRFDQTGRHLLASVFLATILDWLDYTV